MVKPDFVLLLLCGVVGITVGALSLSEEIIEPKVPQYLDRLQQIATTAREWASDRGLPIPSFSSQSGGTSDRLTEQAIGGVRSLLSTASLTVLTISLLVLLL